MFLINIKYRQPWLYASSVIVLLFSGCISEITLDVPTTDQERIAIRGSLVIGEEPHVLVKITDVSNYDGSEVPRGIATKSVVLMDESGHQVELPAREVGEHYLDLSTGAGAVEIATGKTYRVQIELADGTTYLSDWDRLLSVTIPQEITQVSETRTILNESGSERDQEYLRFRITTPLSIPGNPDRTFFKWTFSGTYQFSEKVDRPKICYFSEPLNLENVVVFDGGSDRTGDLVDFFLLEEPYDSRFFETYFLTVRQQSLSEGAFRYWDQLNQVTNRTGSFLEAPAGKVKGNFRNINDESEEIFGYFYATEETVLRYKVNPGEGPVRHLCPDSGTPPSPYCTSCLSHPRSTLIRPDYWR